MTEFNTVTSHIKSKHFYQVSYSHIGDFINQLAFEYQKANSPRVFRSVESLSPNMNN